MNNFVGRKNELETLKTLRRNKKANLVVCLGRRRIGKSTLINHFGSTEEMYYSFQGLAPAQGMNNQDQIDYFLKQLSDQTNYPKVQVSDWDSALSLLAKVCEKKKVTILLDEISWMGSFDKTFPSVLKAVWDREFSQNNNLILVLCGSVSSWIEDNILKNTNFVGRISKELFLREIPIDYCSLFWGTDKTNNKRHKINKVSKLDKVRWLTITGGVPKYLLEINKTDDFDTLLREQCFSPEGFFVKEFDRIFVDIFQKKSNTYKKIIELLVSGSKTFSEICAALKVAPNGKISTLLHHIVIAGMATEDVEWNLQRSNSNSKSSRYRLSDNYIRFFLKYIGPQMKKITSNICGVHSFEMLPSKDSIIGLQFENLILNNIPYIVEYLKISKDKIINWGPYFQSTTVRQKGVQIDLLIQCKEAVYICEIKFRTKIDSSIIKELKEKEKKLKYDRNKYRTKFVLIFAGELTNDLKNSEFIDYFLDIGELF